MPFFALTITTDFSRIRICEGALRLPVCIIGATDAADCRALKNLWILAALQQLESQVLRYGQGGVRRL